MNNENNNTPSEETQNETIINSLNEGEETSDVQLPKLNIEEVKEESVPATEVVESLNLTEANNVEKEAKSNKKREDYENHKYLEFFKDFRKYLTTRNRADLTDLLSKVASIAFIVLIITGTIAWFLRTLIPELLLILNISFTSTNNAVSFVDVIFSILGIYAFLKVCKDRFYFLVNNQKDIEKLKKQ